jgi:N6-adenosine-specific RNA methylase IME4
VSGYRTIVADPPWEYADGTASAPQGDRKRGLKPKMQALPYPSMTAEAICVLPVESLAAADARLFLWTTNRYLPDAFSVLAAWGFRYTQTLIWHKTGNPSPFGGSVAPIHAEFLLVGVRGKPKRGERLSSSVIPAPKPTRAHSQKPDVFCDLVEQVSPGPYVELFARRARFGWDYAGDGSLGTVDVPGLRAPGVAA